MALLNPEAVIKTKGNMRVETLKVIALLPGSVVQGKVKKKDAHGFM